VTRVPQHELVEAWARFHRAHTEKLMERFERDIAHLPEEVREAMLRKVREVIAESRESTTQTLAALVARGMRMDDEPLH
jgi:hypothetical protein